jgi:tetrahydromethanopterin S-methyltransferase subunit G
VSGVRHKEYYLSGSAHPNLIYLIVGAGCVQIGWQLVDELRRDEELRRALAEALGWRVPGNVATKDDIDTLKSYMDTRFDDVNRRIDDLGNNLNQRIDDLDKRLGDLHGFVRTYIVAIMVTLASTIVALVLRTIL